MRDASLTLFVLLLLAVAVSASDAGPVAVSTAAALVATGSAFQLLVTLPSLRTPRLRHVLGTTAAVAPFVWALERAARPGLAWPFASLGVVLGVSALALWSGPTLRRTLAGIAATALAFVPLIAGLSIAAAPEWLSVPTAPLSTVVVPILVPPTGQTRRAAPRSAIRAGALVSRAVATDEGFDSDLIDAPFVGVPADVPGTVSPRALLVRMVAQVSRQSVDGAFVVVASPDLPKDARELDGTDVVLIATPLAVDAEGARALASFVRRGGLLAGPLTPQSFGVELDRALGAAVPAETGARGARSLGAGRVARVAGAAGLEELVAAGLTEPSFGTVFDRATTPPGAPSESGESTAPRLSWRVLLLLGAFTLATIGASRMATGTGALAGLVLAGVAIAALAVLETAPPDARADAFVLDFGGAGGRRLEALRVVAGPEGFRTTTPLRSEGGLRVLGFRFTWDARGRALALGPNAVGWIVEDLAGTAESTGLAVVANAPEWSLALLRRGGGRTPEVRMFGGDVPYRGQVPAGVARPAIARTLVIVPGRP